MVLTQQQVDGAAAAGVEGGMERRSRDGAAFRAAVRLCSSGQHHDARSTAGTDDGGEHKHRAFLAHVVASAAALVVGGHGLFRHVCFSPKAVCFVFFLVG